MATLLAPTHDPAPAAPAGAPEQATTTFPVSGMTCASCVSHVQRALEATPGVTSASVNLLLENATVSFDPGLVSPDRLASAIRAAGYDAHVEASGGSIDEQHAQDQTQAAEYRDLRFKALVSLGAAVIGMIVSMPVMRALSAAVHHDHGTAPVADPFVRWSHTVVDPQLAAWLPWLYAVDTTWLLGLLLALTTLVMTWTGRHFYTRAWSAFRHHTADMNTLVAVGTGAAFLYSLAATLAPDVFVSRGMTPDVLRGRPLHHRADSRRQRVRGAREAPDVLGPARARRAAAQHGPRGS